MKGYKAIKGYESYYSINIHGDVLSLPREVEFINRWGNKCIRRTKLKKAFTRVSDKGYVRVTLCKEGIRKEHFLHKLIAIAFISNPQNKPQINHKDGNKLNNNISNLEWCTQSENQKHAYALGLNIPGFSFNDSQSKRVFMYDLSNNLIKVFGSIGEANRHGFKKACVSRVCLGQRRLYKNYKFSFNENTL